MQEMSPFYIFLNYLALGSVVLTFILQILGIVVAAFALRALLIYIKKNKEPKQVPVATEAATEPLPMAEVEAVVETEGISLEKPKE